MVNIEHVNVESNLETVDLHRVYENIAKHEGFSLGEISLILGDDDWLLEFNRSYLNHDYYTDIITFDYSENEIISGDLLISLTRVGDNAKEYNVSRETELNRVAIHGFLHLCGYDDKTVNDRELMRKKEDYYLKLL